jgi:hypothetical protein
MGETRGRVGVFPCQCDGRKGDLGVKRARRTWARQRHGLEGSRFGSYPRYPTYLSRRLHERKSLLTGGSRERFQRVSGLSAHQADEESPIGAMGQTLRAVIPGSRLFNIIFGLPRVGKNIMRSVGRLQNGSPPVGRSKPFGMTFRTLLTTLRRMTVLSDEIDTEKVLTGALEINKKNV